ncbi:MAG TPA: hypothetical protein VJV76_03720 [Gaiellaceae bacterium]|nr:hypothetical protein [Gaiellaceae bacterium]
MTGTTTVWTDPELADLVAGDPELAAIADALQATTPIPVARRHRRLPVRLGALAATLAAAAALVLFAPWNGGGPAFTDRALAAIGSDPVLHAVVAFPSGIRFVDLATGKPRRLFERQQIWYDRGRGYVHTVTRAPDGSLLDDELDTPQGSWTPAGPVIDCAWIAAHPEEATKLRVSCNADGDNGTTPHLVPRPVPTVDPALGAFLGGYQQALADGEATETGTGTIHGTPVLWVTFPYGHETESVALDASTYRPLFVRDASGTWRYRIVSIETVAQSDANFARPTVTELGRQTASGRVFRSVKLTVDPAAARRVLPGALWLGNSFRDLPLAGLERDTLHERFINRKLPSETGVGLQLVYGSTPSPGVPDRTRPYVQLWESDQPQPAYEWGFMRGLVPPDGVFATQGVGIFGPTGFVVHDGVYVTVMASTPKLALEAAQGLTPISP